MLKISLIFFNTLFLFFSSCKNSLSLFLSLLSLYNCPVLSQHTKLQFSSYCRIFIQQWAVKVDRVQLNHWNHRHNKLTLNVDTSHIHITYCMPMTRHQYVRKLVLICPSQQLATKPHPYLFNYIGDK